VRKSTFICLLCTAFAVTIAGWSIAAEMDDGPFRGPGVGDDAVLATIGDEEISAGQFRSEMAFRSGGLPGQFATAEQRRALLDEMIRYRAMVAQARAEGYDTDPDVIAIFERAMVARFQKDHLQTPLESLDVTDEEVTAYYAEHRSDYDRPERSRAAIVFFKTTALATEEKQQELEERVETALEEVKALDPSIMHFGPVARKYSDDRASRYLGGVIGWLIKYPNRKYKWEAQVVDAVFSLSEPGQMAEPLRTEKGIYLVRLVDRETASPRPFEQVKNGIRHQLMRSKGELSDQAFKAGVLAGINVDVNQEIFSGIEAPASAAETIEEQRPPQLPAG